MRTFLLVVLAIVSLVFFVSLNLREVSERQLVLYQGFYPLSEDVRELQPGDILVVDLLKNSLVSTQPTTCLSEFYSTTPYDFLDRKFTVSISPRVASGNRSFAGNEDSSSLTVEASAISPVDYLSTAFSEVPSCETTLSELVGNDCLLIVRNVISIDNVPVGYDTSDGCQLINTSVDATVINSLAAAEFFDAALGVSFSDRIWTSVTLPLVNLQISD
ncbi:MAG: hypothetical protein AAFP88_03005 [Bacteroidota bacterium]